jgi:hypothetical protein
VAGIEAITTEHAECINDDRLSGTCFTAENTKAQAELQVQRLNDCKVCDAKFLKHRKRVLLRLQRAVP